MRLFRQSSWAVMQFLFKGTIMKKILALFTKNSENSVIAAQADMISGLKSIIDDQAKNIQMLKNESSSLAQQFYAIQSIVDTDGVLNSHLESLLTERNKIIKQLNHECDCLKVSNDSLKAEINEKNCLLASHTRLIEKYKMVLENKRS